MINADARQRWVLDLSEARSSNDEWYTESGHAAYQAARRATVDQVTRVLRTTDDLRRLEPAVLRRVPTALTTLRMSTAPPVARDRLAALSRTERPLLTALEQGRLPARVSPSELDARLGRLCAVLDRLLDRDLFAWLGQGRAAEDAERSFAATVIADRRCGSVGEQILRRAERDRQEQCLARWLAARGYAEHRGPVADLPVGGYRVGRAGSDDTGVLGERTVDTVVRPLDPDRCERVVVKGVPRATSGAAPGPRGLAGASGGAGSGGTTVLLLVGVADQRFLVQGAAAGLDWVWEHRLDDLALVGL